MLRLFPIMGFFCLWEEAVERLKDGEAQTNPIQRKQTIPAHEHSHAKLGISKK